MNKFFQNKWALSILAGTLLGLSFPPVNLSFLSFPAFLLLFHLVEKSDNNKQLAYYSYVGLVIWNVITTYWLLMASLGAGIAAILANSVLMTIPLVFARSFSNKFKSPILIALLQASAWVSYEYLHHHWDLSWPWLALGNAWSNKIELIQYISITGHLVISFWVVLTSALAYQALKTKQMETTVFALVSLFIFPLSSLLISYNSQEINAPTTEVAVIQPNHDSYQNYGGMSGLDEVLDSLFALTYNVKTTNTKLIVWPENAIDGQIYERSRVTARIADSARAWNASFITGTGLIKLYDTPPELFIGTTRGKAYNILNAALYIDEKGSVSHYTKANLVPVVERFPFLGFFTTVDVFGLVNWGKISGFGKGTEPTTITGNSFTTGGLVCYDSVYPAWVREFVNNNSGFITIITNDGWWGNTSGHHQHFAYARLRAIEFNRWVVRSANNGFSGIINPKGEVLAKTEYWTRTGFTFKVPSLTTNTIYTKYGDWLSYLCLITASIFWLVLLLLRFRKTT